MNRNFMSRLFAAFVVAILVATNAATPTVSYASSVESVAQTVKPGYRGRAVAIVTATVLRCTTKTRISAISRGTRVYVYSTSTSLARIGSDRCVSRYSLNPL
jgi:hypothetical protein